MGRFLLEAPRDDGFFEEPFGGFGGWGNGERVESREAGNVGRKDCVVMVNGWYTFLMGSFRLIPML